MITTIYAAGRTALLTVDPYNDFMSEGGKLYERMWRATVVCSVPSCAAAAWRVSVQATARKYRKSSKL